MIYQVQVNGMLGGGMQTIDVGETEEEMNDMTVLELKKKFAEKLPGNPGKLLNTKY